MKAGIERRIRALEAERGPATIGPKGLRGMAGKPRREGEERPPMDPELEAVLFNFGAGAGKDDSSGGDVGRRRKDAPGTAEP